MESDKRSNVRRIVRLQTHPDPYVTTTDLADYWGVSRKQIYKQIDAGTLAAIRLGPHILRINTAEAIRFERMAKMSPAYAVSHDSDRHEDAPESHDLSHTPALEVISTSEDAAGRGIYPASGGWERDSSNP